MTDCLELLSGSLGWPGPRTERYEKRRVCRGGGAGSSIPGENKRLQRAVCLSYATP